MARNGSGTYSLPAGNPVVTGTTISSTTHNTTMSDIATALTNSLAKDGQTTPTANLPMGDFRITGLGDATTATDAAKVSQVQNSAYILLSSMSGTDTITATLSPTPSAYASGQIFIGVAAGTNTGATTLNISSLGAKDVFYGGKALTGGEISEGQLIGFRYDGTQFELIPLNFVSTDSGASAHPSLPLYRNSGNPAADDALGEVKYDGNDDGGNRTTYAALRGKIGDPADGSEAGDLHLHKMVSGTLTDQGALFANSHPTETTIDADNDTVPFYDDDEGANNKAKVGVLGAATLSTEQATTSGRSADFTGIPSWVTHITIMLEGVSINGSTDRFGLRIGDSGGFESSGYSGGAVNKTGGSQVNSSSIWEIMTGIGAAANTFDGVINLYLKDSANNTWSMEGGVVENGGSNLHKAFGSKSLSATLDRVQLQLTGATDDFDAGSINIQYR